MMPNTEELKKALAARIRERISEMGLRQYEVAALLRVDPPRVSAVVRGNLSKFGVYGLLRYVAALGDDVAIVHRPGRGRLSVTAGARE
jgi:predicted XRE-type DNA-binding protein